MTLPLAACAAPHLNPHNSPGLSRLSAHGQQAVRLTAARKRASKRAQIRVLRDGSAMYRGRRHDANSLALQYVGTSSPTKPPRTWNCGGLHAQRYAEFMQWINSDHLKPVHLAFLQECHWPQSAEYCSERWIHIYSGMGSRHGGVMIMINKSIATMIAFPEQTPNPGEPLPSMHIRSRRSYHRIQTCPHDTRMKRKGVCNKGRAAPLMHAWQKPGSAAPNILGTASPWHPLSRRFRSGLSGKPKDGCETVRRWPGITTLQLCGMLLILPQPESEICCLAPFGAYDF